FLHLPKFSVGYLRRWRRDRDSNPGYLAVYTLSKRAPSATRPSLQRCTGQLIDFTTYGHGDSSRTRRGSVHRRQLHAVYGDHCNRAFLRVEFQAELFLERGKEGRRSVIGRCAAGGSVGRFGRPLQVPTVVAREAGLVDDHSAVGLRLA